VHVYGEDFILNYIDPNVKNVLPIHSLFPFLEYPEDALDFYCVTVLLYSQTWHNRNMQFMYIVRKCKIYF